MSFAIDSRGIKRGRCLQCNCSNYRAPPTGSTVQKCIECTHLPTKHEKIHPKIPGSYPGNSQSYQSTSSAAVGATQPQSYATVTSTGVRHTSAQQGSYGAGAHGGYTTPTYHQYQEPVTPPPTGPCKAQDCYKLSYYDPRVGEFDYCSPGCRDKDLLPKERKRLEDDLKAFEIAVKQPAIDLSRGTQKHESSLGQTRSSNSSSFYGTGAASRASTDFRSQDKLPQGQKTFKLIIQKAESKDIGFIIGIEEYRQLGFSGILILGFEYGTKAESLFEKGEVHLLDILTFLNGKSASHFTYPDEVKKSTCSLELNRSIALPGIKKLMDKAKLSNPTHLIAVMNPKDIPGCSTTKFGFDVSTDDDKNYISSSSEDSPARFSMLNFGDEIVAYGFVKGGELKLGSGYLKLEALDRAADDGKTVILVLKRKKK